MAKKTPTAHTGQRLIDLRLGIKLRDVFWPFDTITLSAALAALGYDNIQQSPDQRNVVAEKNQSRFYGDLATLVFGFHSSNNDSLISAQKEFFAAIDKEIHDKLENHVKFYEFEHKAKQTTEKNSFDTVVNLYNGSPDIEKISQVIGLPVKPYGINVIKEDGSPESDNWYQIEVVPQTSSAPNAFVCRLIHRDPSSQTIYDTLRKSGKVLDDLVSFLESK